MTAPTLLTALTTGRLDPAVLAAFPEQSAADRADGDTWVSEMDTLLESTVDPDELDRAGELPRGLLGALRKRGFLTAAFGPELGGAGLSAYNVFRLVATAAARSVPIGQVVGVQAGVGAGAVYPAFPDGPLRDLVRGRIRAGALSGFADTDPAGQNNRLPRMTATPTADGTAYLLHGEKLYTGNGPVADLLAVSATLDGRLCVCVVETASPGFSVASLTDFVGCRGLPTAALRFDGVRVPREHVLTATAQQFRLSPLINSIAFVGRLYLAAAPALAIARNCLDWSRDFLGRRTIDGRPLADHDRIQRIVTATMADVYAMDAVARWCLLGAGLGDRWLERFVARNVLTGSAWRTVDRTVSLLGGEGVETVRSKRLRGAAPLPVERALRDARMLRLGGNVDFRLDMQATELLLTTAWLGAERPVPDTAETGTGALDLTPRNEAHLRSVAGQVRRFAQLCADATRHRADPTQLLAEQEFLVLAGRVVAELVTAAAVLGRTSQLGTAAAQDLADVHCTAAAHRLADLWHRLEHADQLEHQKISRGWLSGSSYGFLTAR